MLAVESSLGEPTQAPIGDDCASPVIVSGCPESQSGIVKWSKWAEKPTGELQNVTIRANQIVLLDETPAFTINKLEIYGQLVFDPSPSAVLTFKAQFIYVRVFLSSRLG